MTLWWPLCYLGSRAPFAIPSASMPPSERWPALLLQLEPDTWTRATDLARTLGVSERTVYRDAQALVEAGVPLQGVPGKGYRLPDDYLLSPVRLTTDEAIMLVLGSAYAAQNFEGRYRATARAAQQKLEDVLPPKDRERALSLRGSVPMTSPGVFGDSAREGLLRQVRHALVEERTMRVTLGAGSDAAAPDATAPDAPSARRLDPYGLVRQGSAWYIVGYGHHRGQVVHIRLSRVARMERTPDTFDRPASYGTPAEGPEPTPQRRIRVLFSAEAAAALQVPPALQVTKRERLSDDRLLLTLRVGAEHTALPWLLGWGRYAKVLEPRALRTRLATEAQAVADQYESSPTLLDG